MTVQWDSGRSSLTTQALLQRPPKRGRIAVLFARVHLLPRQNINKDLSQCRLVTSELPHLPTRQPATPNRFHNRLPHQRRITDCDDVDQRPGKRCHRDAVPNFAVGRLDLCPVNDHPRLLTPKRPRDRYVDSCGHRIRDTVNDKRRLMARHTVRAHPQAGRNDILMGMTRETSQAIEAIAHALKIAAPDTSGQSAPGHPSFDGLRGGEVASLRLSQLIERVHSLSHQSYPFGKF